MSADTTAREAHETSDHGWLFWAAALVGLGFGVVGVRYGLDPKTGANGKVAVRWVLGLLLTHDLIVLPIVGGLGWLAGRLLPRWAAGPARGAAAASALLVAFAWPLVRRYGARADEPSRLPDASYGAHLAVVIAAVWAWALAVAVWRWRTMRRLRQTAPPP
jgi:hypothetical protein